VRRVNAWASATDVRAQIATLRSEDGKVISLENGRDATAVRTVCDVLGIDAESAYAVLPTPDPTLTRLLASGYEAEQKASADCVAGNQSKAATERLQAEMSLEQALARLETVSQSSTGKKQSSTGKKR
jgi:predicted RNA-binding protein YlqC (UPF0109 family)